jgi:hypothetical protein
MKSKGSRLDNRDTVVQMMVVPKLLLAFEVVARILLIVVGIKKYRGLFLGRFAVVAVSGGRGSSSGGIRLKACTQSDRASGARALKVCAKPKQTK